VLHEDLIHREFEELKEITIPLEFETKDNELPR
jgi:hypothetical protein